MATTPSDVLTKDAFYKNMNFKFWADDQVDFPPSVWVLWQAVLADSQAILDTMEIQIFKYEQIDFQFCLFVCF